MKLSLIWLLVVSCASPVKNKKVPKPQSFSVASQTEAFVANSSLPWMHELVVVANCITNNKDFLAEVSQVESFTHSDHTGKQVAESILQDKQAVARTYSKKFTRAAAYRIPNTNKIYINTKKFSSKTRPYKVTPTLMHERMHLLDYKHKGNRRNEYNNLQSVPYVVGKISEKYVEVCL